MAVVANNESKNLQDLPLAYWPTSRLFCGHQMTTKECILSYGTGQYKEERVFICTICGEISPEDMKSLMSRLFTESKSHCLFEVNTRLFLDHFFLPNTRSLFFNQDNCWSGNMRVLQWLRPSQDMVLFREPTPMDVIQGAVGNCWFIASLSAVAEHQHLLTKIIQKFDNLKGCYQVNLCFEGIWQRVVVDDLIPIDLSGNAVYSNLSRGQLFAALIEKAAAKLMKCYQAFDSGNPVESFTMLTGAPCEWIDDIGTLTEDDLWIRMLVWRANRFPMAVYTGDGFDPQGLLSNHCYSIMEMDCVGGLRLVKVRDPTGVCHYTNQEQLWIPQLWNILSNTGGNNGQFWMPFTNFRQLFVSVIACKVMASLYEQRQSGVYHYTFSTLKKVDVYAFQVEQTTEVDLGLWVSGARSLSPRMKQFDIALAVVRFNHDKFGRTEVHKSSRPYFNGYVVVSAELPEGRYALVPILHNVKQDIAFNITLHSNHQIHLQLLSLRKYAKTLDKLGEKT